MTWLNSFIGTMMSSVSTITSHYLSKSKFITDKLQTAACFSSGMILSLIFNYNLPHIKHFDLESQCLFLSGIVFYYVSKYACIPSKTNNKNNQHNYSNELQSLKSDENNNSDSDTKEENK